MGDILEFLFYRPWIRIDVQLDRSKSLVIELQVLIEIPDSLSNILIALALSLASPNILEGIAQAVVHDAVDTLTRYHGVDALDTVGLIVGWMVHIVRHLSNPLLAQTSPSEA